VGETGRVELVAELAGGRTRLLRCSSSGLLGARATPWGVLLVSQGAHVVGDDRIEIDVELGPGARLEVGSIGATLSRRGPPGRAVPPATTTVRARLGEHAVLDWHPEPGIAAACSLHRADTEVEMADGAELSWREEVVLGRLGEEATGSWWSALRCSYAGRPLLVSEVGLGPAAAGWRTSSVLAGARAFCCLLLAGPRAAAGGGPAATVALPQAPAASVTEIGGARGASMALAGPGREIVAAGPALGVCRRVVDSLVAAL
jgi:urease accessory protein